MIRKEKKLVITFSTTTDAMAMEMVCKKKGAEGRIIPVPPTIHAGCGLAWCADLGCEELLKETMRKVGLQEEAMQECMA